ncbi:hypothetical protein XO10_07920 [Marinitoga sp. 1135]|uniref:Polysaccharide pyruvyl transferase domain-containing protein n=1 Tax=Marinitoga piezophila (strain DSM 14283 / JCM 11233 / KA3) TaxID=443254 RepID=H2J4Q4_MARPK|nr:MULTISPECIES: polysaccharide pyruvyl transferase family protein [Marinitoga]AEX85996.1 hypothetical protein Marpi_1606 [Marinitoga piezophila KA3]APT76418.1 hypothetical protein LN42_08540 [Marinitoga sp. 1137]NUU96186.1 hypothetical protein [Marinitoga sp. 1135]NUU98094.1 hypothetical protein [Marinitoga sp. 1138]
MKKIFLIGYYGHGNLGDEMLFESTLYLLQESGFIGEIYVISDKPLEKENFKITNVEKFDIPGIIKTINQSNLIIFGGGNLLQTETSLRSFWYYEFIINIAKHYKKNIVFFSQGFGHFKHKSALRRLPKILKYKNLYGILRDKTSYRYAKRYSRNFAYGVDIGVLKYKNTIFKRDPQKGHVSIVIKNKRNWSKIVKILKDLKVERLTPIVFNKSQDSIHAYEFFEQFEKEINMNFPITDESKIIDEMLKSEFVISDRLHGGILSLYLGTPVILYKNKKNFRVFKSIDYKYNLFFSNEEDILYPIAMLNDFDFEIFQSKFLLMLNASHHEHLDLIKTFL